MGFNFRKFFSGINLEPSSPSSLNSLGDLQTSETLSKLLFHDGSTSSPVVTESHSAVLVNKEMSGSANTFSDIPLSALAGTVVGGPGSSTVNNIPTFADTTGGLLQGSSLTATAGIVTTPSGTNIGLQTSISSDKVLIGFPPNAILSVKPLSGSNGVLLTPDINQSIRVQGFINPAGNGGTVTIRGGDATGGTGGAASLIGGLGSSATASQTSTVSGGANTVGPGGILIVSGGSSNAAGQNGALLDLRGGQPGSGGTPGSIRLGTGTSAGGTTRLNIDGLGNIVPGIGALATTATDGFLHITTSAGAPTGVPTAFTGRAPIHYDTTNNDLYVYDAGWQEIGAELGTGDINQGGNSFGAPITLGTNDNFTFNFETNSVTRLTLSASSSSLTVPDNNTATPLTLRASNAISGNSSGGALNLLGGAPQGSGNGGGVVIAASANNRTSGGNGGDVSITGGGVDASGNAGSITLQAGLAFTAGSTGNGGSVFIKPGSTDLGTPGSTTITRGLDNLAAITVDPSGNVFMGVGNLAQNTKSYLNLRASPGTPSGTPTAYTGNVPITYDSTNDVFYVYNSSFKRIEVTKPEYAEIGGVNINFTNGPRQSFLLETNRSPTLTNAVAGQEYLIRVLVDNGGGFTLTWPASVKWPGGVAPVISTADGAIDIIKLYYDGTNYYGTFTQDYQ